VRNLPLTFCFDRFSLSLLAFSFFFSRFFLTWRKQQQTTATTTSEQQQQQQSNNSKATTTETAATTAEQQQAQTIAEKVSVFSSNIISFSSTNLPSSIFNLFHIVLATPSLFRSN
jgi:hypothetical protein